ncbi:MAG: hypothetical protein HY074_12040, partial [Deltaproteobacteria bacterium]|nr:hypothetical protein [Deltaproteobacteria bacterium]
SLLWQLARRRLGRWPGAALTLGAYLAVDHATAGGYVDGLLMFFLLIEFLAFALTGREPEPVAWLAAMAASLIKAEGVILAGIIAAVFTTFRSRRGLRPFLLFLPALLHKFWIARLGIDSMLKGKTLDDAIIDFFPRLQTALGLAPELWAGQGYTRLRALLWDGLCGLLVTFAIMAILQKMNRLVKIALVIVLLQLAFAFSSISMLPEEVSWFVGTALDRLLLHPAALLTILPFLFLATQKGENAKTR